MKYLLFITIRYRVSLSFIVNKTIQSLILHNANLLDDYSYMNLIIIKSNKFGGFKVHTLSVKFTAVIEIPVTKIQKHTKQ